VKLKTAKAKTKAKARWIRYAHKAFCSLRSV